jgi:hypothetical protein
LNFLALFASIASLQFLLLVWLSQLPALDFLAIFVAPPVSVVSMCTNH